MNQGNIEEINFDNNQLQSNVSEQFLLVNV